ncbi:hypothetical protein QZH36_14705 [Erwinia sp. BC051422]|uniref:DNA methyltransferase n=1 Tax=Erwinia wuhanensis TaxID=3045167 RepID=UPI00265044CA|nr:DNA methyltransferase [Erwinia sp. BC051422]MDN8542672.1 hypothetical protein [Erwinia sp. BC051422]
MFETTIPKTQDCAQVTDFIELKDNIDNVITHFMNEYKNHQQSIEVDFRKLVSWVPYGDSYTHFIHSYPAKLLKHIPIFFLNSKKIMPNPEGTVLDPFCGSGTVLLESVIAGYKSIGCDANPLARLIANVKTTPLNADILKETLITILIQAKRVKKYRTRNVTNIDHWFSEQVKNDLSKIHTAIQKIENIEVRNFYEICFSNIVKKVSFADPNLSVPVKINPLKYSDPLLYKKAFTELESKKNISVFDKFKKQSLENIKRIEKLNNLKTSGNAQIVGRDARSITKCLDNDKSQWLSDSIDLIITSPPYAGAQKYIRASSLSLGWLNYCENNSLRDYEKQNIGREHYYKNEYQVKNNTGLKEIDNELEWIWEINPLRAHININYLVELRSSVKEMYRVLKDGSHCIIVIGNNMVCGKVFDTKKYLKIIAEDAGFETIFILRDKIHSRGLMTKRNKTANVINTESIMVFKK